jgi:hypothetical protein
VVEWEKVGVEWRWENKDGMGILPYLISRLEMDVWKAVQ